MLSLLYSEFFHHADLVGGVLRQLINIVTGEMVALYQECAIIGKGYIPTDVAYFLYSYCGLFNKRPSLFKEWDFKAANFCVSVGVEVISFMQVEETPNSVSFCGFPALLIRFSIIVATAIFGVLSRR